MSLAEKFKTELPKYEGFTFMQYFDRCSSQGCWHNGAYLQCTSRFRDCLPSYDGLDPEKHEDESAIIVVAKLFNLHKPVRFVSSRVVEKGRRNKPIELICENGESYTAYAKKMKIPQNYQRSLVGLELTRLLRGGIPFMYTREYQITAFAGTDLEDLPAKSYLDSGFAFRLGIDEAFREITALEDVRPANHCYDGARIITVDLETVLHVFNSVMDSQEVELYQGLHLLDEDEFRSGMEAGRKLILSNIDQNIVDFAKLISVITRDNLDLQFSFKNRGNQEELSYSDYVLELIKKWSV
jgi:hypothetical protein